MLNGMYELGKFWIHEENMEKIEILLDANKLNNTKKVLFVDTIIDGNNINYLKITEEDFTLQKNINYMYKKGSSRGTNLSPSSLITEPEKTFNQKFFKWFKDNAKKDEFINNIFLMLDENKEKIMEEISNVYDKIDSENNRNVLLTIRFSLNENFKYLNDYEIFKEILLNKANEKYYKLNSKKSKGTSKCYLCDKTTEVYGLVPSSIGLTFATGDKLGNVPDFSVSNQWKQSSICPSCALYLEAGKKFVEKYLSFSEYGLRYYVIPMVFFNKEKVLEEIYDDLLDIEEHRKYSDVVSKEEEFAEIIENLNDILEFKFLYYEASNNSFNISGYVESVLPSWLHKIYKEQHNTQNLPIFNEEHMNLIFGDKNVGNFITRITNQNKKYSLNQYNWYLGLLRDFFSFKNNNKYYIELVNSIMNQTPIDYEFLLKQIMNEIRSNWRDYDNKGGIMRFNVFKALHLIIFLDSLNLFNGGKKMPFENMNETEILNMLESPDKKACFLLGVLTKKVTQIQYSKLESTPFINKLWGLNIDKDKLKQIYTMAINKLTEYNPSNNYFYKEIEEEITLNLIKAENNWKLKKDEVSYYFVLGFTIGDTFELKDGADKNE